MASSDSDAVVAFHFTISSCLDASVVHASGTGQLQANPPVADLRLSSWKSTRRVVAAMGFY